MTTRRKITAIRSVSLGCAFAIGGYAGPFEWSIRYQLTLFIIGFIATMLEDIADWYFGADTKCDERVDIRK